MNTQEPREGAKKVHHDNLIDASANPDHILEFGDWLERPGLELCTALYARMVRDYPSRVCTVQWALDHHMPIQDSARFRMGFPRPLWRSGSGMQVNFVQWDDKRQQARIVRLQTAPIAEGGGQITEGTWRTTPFSGLAKTMGVIRGND